MAGGGGNGGRGREWRRGTEGMQENGRGIAWEQ